MSLNRGAHEIAVASLDGGVEVFEADELRVCVPTKECIRFWATIVACFVGMGLGIWLMVFQGTASAYYYTGHSLLLLCVGVLIPGPDVASMKQKVQHTRPATP